MKRRSALRNRLNQAASTLPGVCAALFLAALPLSQAQNPGKPAVPGGADASGAVIVPPVTDPGIAKPAPPNADMPAVKPPAELNPDEVRKLQQEKINGAVKGATKEEGMTKEEASKQPSQRRSGRGTGSRSEEGKRAAPATEQPSEKAECKGPAELCKQDSAR